MHPALKAALARLRTLVVAVAAGSLAHAGQAAVEPQPAATSSAEEQAWSEARSTNTAASYQRYLELFPVGRHAEEAFRLLIAASLQVRPVSQLVDIEPPLYPGGPEQQRVVAAAALSLY